MEFKELQNKAVQNALRYGKEYNIEVDEDFALLKLYEEVGEFAQAVLVQRKKSRPEKYISKENAKENLSKELADILGMVMVNAHLLDIDLENALKEKGWVDREK
jgi:NTP pyrophosphatase (non-canonical NTP hydrolase)